MAGTACEFRGQSISRPKVKWCSLHFPAKYGMLSNDQFSRLLRLAREGYKIDVNLDCKTSIKHEALAQIRTLAVHNQYKKAALALLGSQRSEELHLDGEIAEEFAGEYILPTLEKYDRLSELLTPQVEESIVREICGWAASRKEMKRVELVKSNLLRRGYTAVAKKIESECGLKP